MSIGSARYWREIPQRYRYEAAQCKQCGKIFFPPRLVCSGCRGREFSAKTLSPDGVIETFTVIRIAPTGFGDEAPYAVGVIKLDDGVKITAQIVDCEPESLKIGDRVKLEFRLLQQDGESGILCYGYKFVPVLGA
jgi:uncharacterized OB-fold protein